MTDFSDAPGPMVKTGYSEGQILNTASYDFELSCKSCGGRPIPLVEIIRNGVDTLASSSVEGPEGCVEVAFITSDAGNLLGDLDQISCSARNGIMPNQESSTRVTMTGWFPD